MPSLPIPSPPTQTPQPVGERFWTSFEEQLIHRPQQLAVRDLDHEQTITYACLQQRVQHVASHLRDAGVSSGALVGIFLERSVEALIATLAVLWAGGAFLPLDPTLPAFSVEMLLEQGQVSMVLTRTALEASLSLSQECPVLCLDTLPEEGHMPTAAFLSLDAPGCVLLTAGTYGLSKAVHLSRQQLRTIMEGSSLWPLSSTDRLAQICPFWSFQAFCEVWSALACGATLVLLPSRSLHEPSLFRQTIREEGITTMCVPTALFHRLARQLPNTFAPLHTLLVGGEALHTAAVRAIQQAGAPSRLLSVYGLTEAGGWCLGYDLQKRAARGTALIPLGCPRPDQSIAVLDPAGEIIETEEAIGELMVGGAMIAQEYLGMPELTAATFHEHLVLGRLVRTGDLVSWRRETNEQRVLVWEGRREAVFLRHDDLTREGARLEARLAQHEAIAEAAVLVRRRGWLGAYLVLTAKARQQLQANSFDAWCRTLGAWLKTVVPTHRLHLVLVETLPLTPLGRLDRDRLARGKIVPLHLWQAPMTVTLDRETAAQKEGAHV